MAKPVRGTHANKIVCLRLKLIVAGRVSGTKTYLCWHAVQGLADVHQHPDQAAHLVLDRAHVGLLRQSTQVAVTCFSKALVNRDETRSLCTQRQPRRDCYARSW